MKSIFAHTNGRGYAYNRVVGIVILDMQNAFDSVSWLKILKAAVNRNVPSYLLRMISEYLSHRSVIVKITQATKKVEMSCGAPQGSVLGPNYWNLLYDDLMRIPFLESVVILAFANDVALVASAQGSLLLKKSLEKAVQKVIEWMSSRGLKLCLEKTEVIVLTNRYKHNQMVVRVNEHKFESKPSVKYLGIEIDQRMHFAAHAKLVSKRAV